MHQTHAALVVIVLNSAANIAVVLMQTLKFVDKGQVEAAQSLGLNKKTNLLLCYFPTSIKKISYFSSSTICY
ncbi:hypothetical protein [Rice orange leaf phytoplasma]|uniref:hypothetical protein n=1 Tax=Rice orange leaf phytoplasma TaxID=146897 RepID=UPI0008F5AD84|nr:hypothetical protein [Rice orange leaf phytoplasma]OIJ45065.1 hypothetical protein BHE82_00710 [Rice orange leaf phytoplasma]